MSDSHHARFPSADKIRELVSTPLEQQRAVGVDPKETIPKRPVQSPCPASFAQQRLWFVEQMSPTAYNLQIALRLKQRLKLDCLHAAWHEMLKRHELLRTTFGLINDRVMQFISPELKSSWNILDLTRNDSSQRESQVHHLLQKEGQQNFDLAKGPLVRPVVIRLAEEEYTLCFTMHHIIADGWSLAVLVRELRELYAAFSENRSNPLPPLTIQYADFASWQRQRLSGDLLEKQLSYWRRQLSNTPVLALPADHPRTQKETLRGAYWHFQIDEHLARPLRELGRRHQASLFMVLLAAWQVLLCRCSGQTDIAIGAPIANRTRVEIEPLIGFFVNTLVMRTDLSGNPTFKEVLSRVRSTTLDAYEHQDLPYEKLVADLQPERTAGQTPFFTTMLNWVNTPGIDFEGVQSESAPLEHPAARFDLALHIMETSGALPACFEYSLDLYEEATISLMAGHFHHLLTGIATDADQRISELPLLGSEELSRLLYGWNQTASGCPRDGTLVELLEAQAQKTPEHPAILCLGNVWSYRELHQRANQIAHFLKKLGVGPEIPVGICMERSPQLVAALLGVLKAGAAYVPLDSNYPAERLRYTLEDSGTQVLLTQEKFLIMCSFYKGTVINLDERWQEISDENVANPGGAIFPESLAYVIYTSGSTGRPKGVAIQHGSAAVMLRWAHQLFSLQELARVLASTSICFDLSIFEIFAPLSCGGTVLITADAFELSRMRAAGITLINTVPSVMRELVNSRVIPESVRTVNLAGEVLPPKLARDLYANSQVEKVFNLYGPSEDTTYSTYMLVGREAETVPIGRAIANTQAYVLDEWMQPAPTGVVGELYLGGDGLARGYLSRSALTAERFVPNPFSSEPGERMYKTGDRVRWRSDGTLEFLGRTDQQIKIRGTRIELGEIESVLRAHRGIRQAAVIARDDNAAGKQILAFVTPNEDRPPTIRELRNYVKSFLPAYMTPSSYVFADRLPLNENGKIDQRSLALLPLPETSHKDVLPNTPIEKTLCRIWANVLKCDGVGVEDDFFALGGHSLLAVNLISQIAQQFGHRLTFNDIFQHPTPREMAYLMDQGQKNIPASELVCMNKGSADVMPLYLVHPIGGNVLCYSDLARSISQKQPFYAIQALPGGKLKDFTIEEIASFYSGLLAKQNRQGRYAVGGWSFGGLVAFEMAQQATTAGDPPAILYLFDPPAPQELQANVWTRDQLVSTFVLTLVADFNGGLLELQNLKIDFDPRDLSLEAQLKKAAELGLLPANTAIEAHAHYFEVFRRNMLAATIYQPRKYSGTTVLVLPALRHSEIWPGLLPVNTTIARVPGNHFTMIRGSSAGEVAQWIESRAYPHFGSSQREFL